MLNNGLKKEFKAANGVIIFAFAIAANLFVQFLAAIIIMVSQFLGGDISKNVLFNYLLMLLIQTAFFLIYYLGIIRRGHALTYGYKNKINYIICLLAAALAVMSISAFFAPATLFALILEKINFTAPALEFMTTPMEFIVGVFVIVIAAPVCEELICRGALLSGLSKKHGPHISAILSAAAFALMHMNPSQTVYQFLLGLVLAYTAIYSRSVIPSIIIHSVSNVLAILLDYTPLGDAVLGFINSMQLTVQIVVGIAFFIVFSGLIIVVLKFTNHLTNKEKDVIKGSVMLSSIPLAENLSGGDNIKKSKRAVNDGQKAAEGNGGTRENGGKEHLVAYVAAIGLCGLFWIMSLVIGIMGIGG